VTAEAIDAARTRVLPKIQAALAENPIDARITVSGYEGSELLVARALIEAGAEVPYVGTACPRTPWSDPDREWLEAQGTHVQYRASLEQDVAAMLDVRPDLAVGTTPLVQKAKELGIPALYFTNMVSARPLFGAAGAGALAGIVAGQMKGRERFARMVGFFDKVGTGEAAGYGWKDVPKEPKGARERLRKAREAKAKAAASQAMGS
jgi:chlorophyllide a reductase subunit Y